MSVNDLDDELLALAGGEESGSDEDDGFVGREDENAREVKEDDESEAIENEEEEEGREGDGEVKQETAIQKPHPDVVNEQANLAPKGVARRKVKARGAAAKRVTAMDIEEDEESSAPQSPHSMGSRAMSESDSDAESVSAGNDLVVGLDYDESGSLYPVDGKFKSQKDKDELLSMPEAQREQILSERMEELEKTNFSRALRQRMQAQQEEDLKAADKRKRKTGATDFEDSPRASSRPKTKATENLENYKRQREQRQEQRSRDDANKIKPSTSRRRRQSSDNDSSSEVDWDDQPRFNQAHTQAKPELRDYERCRIGRSNFARVCFTPGFEKAIAGCFTRVNVGLNRETKQMVYRMCQIKGFTTGKTYSMESSNGKPFNTDQYAIVSHGKAEKEWPFIACSDGKFTESEFERFKRAQTEDNIRLPSHSFISRKLEEIHTLLNHQWTEAEISEKIRRSGVLQSKYAIVNHNVLQQERESAVARGDEGAILRIDRELAELDTPRSTFGTNVSGNQLSPRSVTKAPTQQDRIEKLNRANRKANQEEVRRAQAAERRREYQEQAAVARGEAQANPFARVKTRAKVHHQVPSSTSDSLNVPTNKHLDDLFEGTDPSRGTTPQPTSTANGTPRAGTPKRSGPPKSKPRGEDEILGALDFEIDIDI